MGLPGFSNVFFEPGSRRFSFHPERRRMNQATPQPHRDAFFVLFLIFSTLNAKKHHLRKPCKISKSLKNNKEKQEMYHKNRFFTYF